MFYKAEVKDHIRVPPTDFDMEVEDAIVNQVKEKYDGYISKDLGIVVGIVGVNSIKEGIIIPGDGASYYETNFDLVCYTPEMQEVVMGHIKDIADFGAFINFGPIEGMIHVSQTMDDVVSFSKEKVLLGKQSKRNLKVGDNCRARVIAISYKEVDNPKLGLTMRQPGLGKLEWMDEDLKKENKKE